VSLINTRYHKNSTVQVNSNHQVPSPNQNLSSGHGVVHLQLLKAFLKRYNHTEVNARSGGRGVNYFSETTHFNSDKTYTKRI
jgi:hypothetical protein